MMEHWIEITPDEVGSWPFVIYFTAAPPPNPLPTPSSLQPLHPFTPLPPVFSPQEHIMVIRQYVCIGINQGKAHCVSYDMVKSVCNFWLMGRFTRCSWINGAADNLQNQNMDALVATKVLCSCSKACVFGKECCTCNGKLRSFSWQCMAAQWRRMPSQIPLISGNVAFTPLVSLSPFSSTCLIYKVVMAIRSNVISCHINTYISGGYY